MTATNEAHDFGAINLEIFERVMGAQRVKLDRGVYGHIHQGKEYPCLEDFDRFDDRKMWEAQYGGPDFCNEFLWIFAAEAAMSNAELMGFYVESLAKRVYPNWNTMMASTDVVDFWYSLAHASPMDRALSISAALAMKSRHNLKGVIEEAISLATTKGEPLLDFLRNLTPWQAEGLAAVIYLGRGDHPTFDLALEQAAGAPFYLYGMVQQMADRGLLVKYLQDGMTKLPIK